MEYCKRCGYSWTPKKKTKPSICPRCKTKKWDIKKIRKWEKKDFSVDDIIEYSNKSIKSMVDMEKLISSEIKENYGIAEMNSYLSSRLLITLISLLCESEKKFDAYNPNDSIDILSVCSKIVAAGLLPKEMDIVFSRIKFDMMRDHTSTIRPYKACNPTEKELMNTLTTKWSDTIFGSDLDIVSTEHELPDLDRIDILAKDKSTGQDVIIELKKGDKNGYRQLRAYAFFSKTHG